MIIKQGKKVELVTATEQLLKALYYWKFEEEKQEAAKWNGPYMSKTEMTWEEFYDKYKEDKYITEGAYDSLYITAEGEFIGTVGCYWIDQNTNWLETGIVIYNHDYWNGGYGTEAYRLWIDYLFQNTSLHRLGMSTWSGNDRMMKVAEKLGMSEEARIRQARIVDGFYYDAIKMGMLREEWLNMSWNLNL